MLYLNKKFSILSIHYLNLNYTNNKLVNKRDYEGPLIPLTQTNEELGWYYNNNCDIEIHYDNLYNLTDYNYLWINLKDPSTIYDNIDKYEKRIKTLEEEYNYITKYLKTVNHL